MANLSEQLPLADGIKPVRSADVMSAGSLIFGGLSRGLNALNSSLESERADAYRKATLDRQRKEDSYRDEERLITFRANNAMNDAFNTSQNSGGVDAESPFTLGQSQFLGMQQSLMEQARSADTSTLENVAKAASGSIDILNNTRTSVEQGRLPQISLTAAMDMQYQQLMAQFPTHGESIAKAFKDAGFIPSQAQQTFVDQQASHDAKVNATLDARKRAYQVGVESMGEISTGMTDDDIIRVGLRTMKVRGDLADAEAQLRLTQTQANISKTEKDASQDDLEGKISARIVQDAWDSTGDLNKAMLQISQDIMNLPPGTAEAEFRKRLPTLAAAMEAKVNSYITYAITHGMSQPKAEGLRNTLKGIMDQWKVAFDGPFDVSQQNSKALQSFSASMKLDTAQAMPTFFGLLQNGFKAADFPAIQESIAKNPELANALKNEILGLKVYDPSSTTATIHFQNIQKLLKGDMSILQMTPKDAAAHMPQVYNATMSLSRDYVAGKNVSPELVVNGISQIALAGSALNPNSPVTSFNMAADGIGRSTNIQSLLTAANDPNTKDQALTAIQASRDTAKYLLRQMRSSGNFEEFRKKNRDGWHIIFQDGRLSYRQAPIQIRSSEVRTPRGDGGFIQGPVSTTTIMSKAPVPQNMKMFVDAWNLSMDAVVKLNEVDPNGNKGVSALELQRWFGEGKVPESQKETQKAPTTPQQSFYSHLSEVDSFLSEAYKPFDDTGVTGDFADQIAGAENSTGNPNAKNPRSSARGDGQFTDATWLKTIKAHEPGRIKGMSDAEILALRSDPALSRRMITAYAGDNAMVLQQKGLPAGPGELSLAHFAGAEGAVKILQANPSTPIEQVLSASAISSNPFLKGKTVQWVREWAAKRIKRA